MANGQKQKTPQALVKPCSAKKKIGRTEAKLGKQILDKPDIATVLYRNKEWTVGTLLVHLAAEVKRLSRIRCKPKLSCLFKAQNFIDDNYIGEK